jgi:hypothetical protein
MDLDNYSSILQNGFNIDERPVYTSIDKSAARNAISNSRADVQRARYEGKLDRGIIASDIPYEIFTELLQGGDIKIQAYSGFDGANLNTQEVKLSSEKAVQVFNTYRRPEGE